MAGVDSYYECAEAPVIVVVICDGHEDSQDSHSSLGNTFILYISFRDILEILKPVTAKDFSHNLII